MADYSKEYCDNHDKGFPHDFSILEEFESIPEGHYRPIICEGYGFIAIGKIEGKATLFYRDLENDNETIQVPIEELETYYQKHIHPSSYGK